MIDHPNDRRDQMPTHKSKIPLFRVADDITHGVIHQTGVTHGRTADQHVEFHIRPEKYTADGKPLNHGRGWPTGAYTSYIGKNARRELLLDYEIIGYHCKGINSKSIGVVAEGAFHLYPPTEDMVAAIVDECLWHEANLGRRLIWTWHDVVRKGWNCPGKYFPKDEVLRRIEEFYTTPADGDTDASDQPGGLPYEPDEPEEPEPDEPDYDSPPGDMTGRGCLALLIPFLNF